MPSELRLTSDSCASYYRPALNVIGFQTLPCKMLKNLETLNPKT